jgi:hypothetical protein
MQIDPRAFQDSAAPVPGGPEVARVKASAHGLFQRIACRWGLSARQRLLVLNGAPTLSGLSGPGLLFDTAFRPHEAEILQNIAEVLEIFLLCRACFGEDSAAADWLRAPGGEHALAGIAPITWLVHGGREGLHQLRQHLTSLKEARHAAPPEHRGAAL